jgi:peptide/nickel transport system permease protein
MGRYIVRRVLYLVVVLLVITFVTYFIFFQLPPTDPTTAFAGKLPTEEIREEVRKVFGLDKPMLVQYGLFVRHIFLGDEFGWPGLGFSFASRVPIKDIVFERAVVTLQLALGGAIIWLLVGIPIGIVSALKRRTLVDRASMTFALVGVSAPNFWLGLLGLYVFWRQLGLSAGTGYVPLGEDPGQWFAHMWLPWVIIAVQFSAFYARMVRGNLLETLGEDYIRTARAKGLSERKVIGKHGLRASLTPVVTMFGMDFAFVLSGAIITENVFNLPGLGVLVVDSAVRGDLPVILATTVIGAFFISFFALIVDILYAYLDPRVRYS